MKKSEILIADDDPKIRSFLEEFFSREGFQVYTAVDGTEVLEKLNTLTPDLIILDIMMPKMDGLKTCREIRKRTNVPILFLSAKDEEDDIIIGLTHGCDDYISKPFNVKELLLRVRAILRRAGDGLKETNKKIITLVNMVIDSESRTVKCFGKKVSLTRKEFDLLWLLASRPEKVYTRDQLIRYIWRTDYCDDSAIVTTLVKRLRRKIETDPNSPQFVITVRGIGYKFGGCT